VYAEQAAEDALFKDVIESYNTYSEAYEEYRTLNSID
jgi:TRAP-type mannitol/chloroaromatic compound transport system substrate-binding protein